MKNALKRDLAVATAVLAAACAPLAGCANQNGSQRKTSGTESMTAELKSAEGTVVGNATFDFADGYVTVTVEAGPNQVLSPGFRGLRIHSIGDCQANSAAPTESASGAFSSAGDVYQASGHTGYPASGDLTALQVRSDGSAKLVTTSNSFTAADLRSSSGSALVVHQDANYLADSSSDEAGSRVACGVIAAAATSSSSTTTTTTTETVTTTVVVPPPAQHTDTVTVTTPTATPTPAPTVTLPPSTTLPTITVPGG